MVDQTIQIEALVPMMKPEKWLLAVDPAAGKPQAFAFLSLQENRPVREYGRCSLEELRKIIARENVEEVACEDQYVGKQVYWSSMLKLAHVAGRIWEMVEVAEKRFRWVPPSAWQALVRGPDCHKREDLLERAMRHALFEIRVSGLPVPTKLHLDIAQAICIGVWAAGRSPAANSGA